MNITADESAVGKLNTGNIILIGMPSAGKSTVGVVLAKILTMEFVDGDLLIQNQCDRTLQRIIDAMGPEGFIAIENQVLSEVQITNTVLATGGSAVYSDDAMSHLGRIGRVVYLQISYEEMVKRLGDIHERGVVLKGGAGMSLRELYDERLPLYERYADLVVNVDDLSLTAAARKVADAVVRDALDRRAAAVLAELEAEDGEDAGACATAAAATPAAANVPSTSPASLGSCACAPGCAPAPKKQTIRIAEV